MKRNYDCIDGNMDVLMYDNTTKKVRDLKKNDAIYSISYDGEGFRYVKGSILGISKRKSDAVKITLKDGRSLISSPNHQWLTQQGWHFSFDEQTTNEPLCFLKDQMIMFGFSKDVSGSYKESPYYMEGYITSTEIYGGSLAPLCSGDYADFVFRNPEITKRIYDYLSYFGIEVRVSDYWANDIDTNECFWTDKISISYKVLLKFSEKAAKHKDEPEFIRGFVAGVYDSDGNINPITKRIKSAKREYLEIMKKGMDLFEFEYSYNCEFLEISLMGGPTELIRFYNIFTPVTTSMVENLTVRNRRVANTRITSIQETKCTDLYEITTTSRNLIVNGIVCHDCTSGIN